MSKAAISLIGGILIGVSATLTGATAPARDGGASPIHRVEAADAQADRDLTRLRQQRLKSPEDDALFADAAAAAWQFVARHVQPQTGLIAPVSEYSYATVWDLASMMAALYSARELGLIDRPTYAARMGMLLDTLHRMPLYADAIFGRSYDTRTGSMAQRSADGRKLGGWSALDVGRLLVWLRIVGADPAYANQTAAIVRRLDLQRIVRAGYLWGADLDASGKTMTYQEGRIGYEQYAARGYELWDARADHALNVMTNAIPITVEGEPLPADVRGGDRLNGEPFLLTGLELGWDPEIAQLMRRIIRAEQRRAERTGVLTLTGEDAVAQPPYFFYYYCIYTGGRQFAVDVQDPRASVDGPRWLGVKSAFALHALMPSRYSQRALDAVRGARTADGWSSGIYERTGRSTDAPNINTAAVILTAALVQRTGEPALAHAERAAAAAGAR